MCVGSARHGSCRPSAESWTAPRRTPRGWDAAAGRGRRSWTLLLIVAGLWGGSFMLTAIAIRDLAVPVVAFMRTAMGALVLAPIALRRGALAGLRAQLWP